MARKGNHQRNGLNCHTADVQGIDSDGFKENSEMRSGKTPETEYPNNADNVCQPRSPVGKINKTKANGKRNKQRSGCALTREKPDGQIPSLLRSEDRSSGLRDPSKSNLSSNSFEEKRDDGKFCHYFDGLPIGNNNGAFLAVASRNLRSLALYVLGAASEWLERQKPRLKVINSVIRKSHNYARVKVGHAYPIILAWTLYLGKLIFLLSMVWLDCSIRGLDSLLRLGTTSFLTTIWCSILSITAMIGFMKILVVMVISTAMIVFIGIGLTILVVAILAMGILWFYGSFWTTGLVSLFSGVTFMFGHERVALLISTVYSMYCTRCYVGWLGLLFGLNVSFISSDILIHILKNNTNDSKSNDSSEHTRQTRSRAGHFFGESSHSSLGDDAFQSSSETPADRCPGVPSTSGTEAELSSEDEVARLLNCADHYSALGLTRYENVDASYLKKEYRKKAMLVHPDKNMGNEKAADAFKKLQNAYEVLLDSLKRKTYDEELRREELLNYFRRFQNSPLKKGGQGIFRPGFSHSEAEYEGPYGEARRIACKKCSDFHVWICTDRSKSQARWCQDCKEFHQSKDGDGWVEQSFQPLLFGLLQKVDPPRVYVCAKSKVYEVTEWFICQGMKCPANTHKPSFHVNTSLTKQTSSKGSGSAPRGGGATSNNEEAITEEEFFEWLQNAMQSGMFEANNNSTTNESPSPGNGSCSKGSFKKKKKGKKQW
ncbi:uncharacterized protein LOC103978924 isoform X1 [Musa acuminata AAA Group]|uniref:uncharacterized protein LOC103978924 isoform X1 n=1 Tax=Musa acuminata AAA Group TaxID=214697 RepID=UPI0031D4EF1F